MTHIFHFVCSAVRARCVLAHPFDLEKEKKKRTARSALLQRRNNTGAFNFLLTIIVAIVVRHVRNNNVRYNIAMIIARSDLI